MYMGFGVFFDKGGLGLVVVVVGGVVVVLSNENGAFINMCMVFYIICICSHWEQTSILQLPFLSMCMVFLI